MSKEKEEDIWEDPAKSAPYKRAFIRGIIAKGLLILALIIPLLVFALISVYGGFPDLLGMLAAFLSFIVYMYIVVKKELWNMIKR